MEQFWEDLYAAAFDLSPGSPGADSLQPFTTKAELTFVCHSRPLHAFTLDEVQSSDWFRTLGIDPFDVTRLPH